MSGVMCVLGGGGQGFDGEAKGGTQITHTTFLGASYFVRQCESREVQIKLFVARKEAAKGWLSVTCSRPAVLGILGTFQGTSRISICGDRAQGVWDNGFVPRHSCSP